MVRLSFRSTHAHVQEDLATTPPGLNQNVKKLGDYVDASSGSICVF